MGTAEPIVLNQISDEDLAAQYLALRRSGKCGSHMYQCVEAEMRARNLIRESRFETSYTASHSSFSPRSSPFSSFR
jgi:hypothetical protein